MKFKLFPFAILLIVISFWYGCDELTEITNPKQWRTISKEQLIESGYPVYGANGFIGYYHEYNHDDEMATEALERWLRSMVSRAESTDRKADSQFEDRGPNTIFFNE